jgi:hypothetical protein
MPVRRTTSKKSAKPRDSKKSDLPSNQDMSRSTGLDTGMATGLNSIHITPRTPISARTPFANGHGDDDELELSLLTGEERRSARVGAEEEVLELEYDPKRPISPKDKRAMVLLCVLCKSSTCVVRLRT